MRITLEDLKAAVRFAERAGVDEIELHELPCDDGLAGWPRTIRLSVAAERALRSIGNLPREERDTDKENES